MPETSSSQTASQEHRQGPSGYVLLTTLLIFVLVLAVAWLYVEVGRIDIPDESRFVTLDWRVRTNHKAVGENSSGITALASDISTMASELSYVGALARNADAHAHTHTYSDIRLKRNRAQIDSPLGDLLRIRGLRFDWDRDTELALPEGPQVGVIAQEVEEVFPELVHVAPEGYKTVDYAKLTPILIEAIREQQGQIDSLEEDILRLERRLDAKQEHDRD